ncbi:hypothetical protein KC19_VG233800 [Ceratodon purpureus]|uniref:Uncharacterized protein n=1 Tax=Ceratodon purpureus TaxID=3225 RepID=A0A8T0HTH5_CERPU|nr:hypothetical protein KC19_VG233800 [Ceratodon purpureus]
MLVVLPFLATSASESTIGDNPSTLLQMLLAPPPPSRPNCSVPPQLPACTLPARTLSSTLLPPYLQMLKHVYFLYKHITLCRTQLGIAQLGIAAQEFKCISAH